MDMLFELVQDMGRLWSKYGGMYMRGIGSTLVLALIATLYSQFLHFPISQSL